MRTYKPDKTTTTVRMIFGVIDSYFLRKNPKRYAPKRPKNSNSEEKKPEDDDSQNLLNEIKIMKTKRGKESATKESFSFFLSFSPTTIKRTMAITNPTEAKIVAIAPPPKEKDRRPMKSKIAS